MLICLYNGNGNLCKAAQSEDKRGIVPSDPSLSTRRDSSSLLLFSLNTVWTISMLLIQETLSR